MNIIAFDAAGAQNFNNAFKVFALLCVTFLALQNVKSNKMLVTSYII
jgi:hypothetical protein